MAEQDDRRSGWWWRFVALISGAPPVAVWGAEDEVEQERTERAGRTAPPERPGDDPQATASE